MSEKPLMNPENDTVSKWPYRIGVLLATLVFPLIWLGGLVTTTDAGMAVPDWPGTYGYNMFLYPLETWLFGPFDLLVEHGHRLLASLSGLVAILLVFVTFRAEKRKWVSWFSVALLGLIILQGGLGGARVLFDDRFIAKIHGCVGPAFFCSVVAFCVVNSKWWFQISHPSQERCGPSWIAKTAAVLLLACFFQLFLGALIRHVDVMTPPAIFRGLVVLHVSLAILIVLATGFQWCFSRLRRFAKTGIRGSANWVAALVFCQFCLGLGTWLMKYGWPSWLANSQFAASFVIGEKSLLQSNLVTAHVAIGSLILAFWTVHTLRCFRVLQWSRQQTERNRKRSAHHAENVKSPLGEEKQTNQEPQVATAPATVSSS